MLPARSGTTLITTALYLWLDFVDRICGSNACHGMFYGIAGNFYAVVGI